MFKKDEKFLVQMRSKGGEGAPNKRFLVEEKVIKKVKELKTIRYL